VAVLPLFRDAVEDVRLEDWAPGARIHVPTPGRNCWCLPDRSTSRARRFTDQSWLRRAGFCRAFDGVAGRRGLPRPWSQIGSIWRLC
jgi:hypothetical protein